MPETLPLSRFKLCMSCACGCGAGVSRVAVASGGLADGAVGATGMGMAGTRALSRSSGTLVCSVACDNCGAAAAFACSAAFRFLNSSNCTAAER